MAGVGSQLMRKPLGGMTPARTMLLVAVLCAPSLLQTRDPDFAHGNPRIAAGTWRITLARSGVPSIIVSARIDSTLHHDSVAIPSDTRTPYVVGSFVVDSARWLMHLPRSDHLSVYTAPDSSVLIRLDYNGPCDDCGRIDLVGRLRGGSILGKWSEELVSGGQEGMFEARRAR